MNSKKTEGCVYLVGAGPGDPGLMTLRGQELLERADCVVYDALVSHIILGRCRRDCELIDVGKRAGNHTLCQEAINSLLIECAGRYKCTVRLKGGDPYVFGRGGEEALALHAAGVPFDIVPGVCSAIAGPAYAGIPVTHRDYCSQLTIFTGHTAPGKEGMPDISAVAAAPGTRVMLMGMAHLSDTMQALQEAGLSGETPAAAIQWATTVRQRTVQGTVASLAQAVNDARLSSPAIVVIGDVVKLAPELNQRSRLPLAGKRIIVTRMREQVAPLSRSLRDLGAEVAELPTMRLVPPPDKRAFASAVINSPHHDWLVFSSPNGVKKFFEAFYSVYEDIRELGGCRIAAIGPGTAEQLRMRGLMVDVMPQKAVAEELIAEFDRRSDDFGGLAHCTVLWVHAKRAREVIRCELEKRKAIVDECIAYDVDVEEVAFAQQLLDEGADFITFTSSGTATHFVRMGLRLPPHCCVASLGPVTAATLRKLGMPPQIEAEMHTIPGLVESIRRRAIDNRA